jgi:hypothetical protein
MAIIANTKQTIEVPGGMIRDERLTIYSMGVYLWLHNFESVSDAQLAWVRAGNDIQKLNSSLGELARADYLAPGAF